MKTILIVIAGMADLPDPLTLRETPLVSADIPALDTLARRGEFSSFITISEKHGVSHKNALLSILGYDLDRGEPSTEELMEFGLEPESSLTDFPTLRPFIIPGFSGHGVCVTNSAWVRGVAKCGLLRVKDIYSPGLSDPDVYDAIVKQAVEAVGHNEFVLVYVDSPLKASLRGNYNAKIEALENIDRHLISPIADFVWKSDFLINLAITSDLVTPWHRRRPSLVSVPVVVYFNNHDQEGNPEQNFTEVESMLMNRPFESPCALIRYLCSFSVAGDEEL